MTRILDPSIMRVLAAVYEAAQGRVGAAVAARNLPLDGAMTQKAVDDAIARLVQAGLLAGDLGTVRISLISTLSPPSPWGSPATLSN